MVFTAGRSDAARDELFHGQVSRGVLVGRQTFQHPVDCVSVALYNIDSGDLPVLGVDSYHTWCWAGVYPDHIAVSHFLLPFPFLVPPRISAAIRGSCSKLDSCPALLRSTWRIRLSTVSRATMSMISMESWRSAPIRCRRSSACAASISDHGRCKKTAVRAAVSVSPTPPAPVVTHNRSNLPAWKRETVSVRSPAA